MPADQLSPGTTATPQPHPTPDEVANGVLAVLAGSSPAQAAIDLGMSATDLVDATHVYHQAGRAALAAGAITHDWYQVHVEFPAWGSAEETAVGYLGPTLQRLEASGGITAWWFIRKAPCWRLRLQPAPKRLTNVATSISSALDELTTHGQLSGWRRTLYEPEVAAYGGLLGMDIAHRLFYADSTNIVAYLSSPKRTIGRRELSVLLCCALFRAAGQEWFECGDVWHRVARLRPLRRSIPANQHAELSASLGKLLTYDVRTDGSLFGTDGPLDFAASWAAAFHQAGRELRTAADDGSLERGTRDILAYHVIFHWNRLGISATTQGILANVAKAIILEIDPFR